MCAESLEDLSLFQTFDHLQSNNLCHFERVLDIGLSCFHLIMILVLKVGQTLSSISFSLDPTTNSKIKNLDFNELLDNLDH